MDVRKSKYIPTSIMENGELTNFDISPYGIISKVGYNSLRGAIKMLKEQNKKLKVLGCKVTFTITLPIPY